MERLDNEIIKQFNELLDKATGTIVLIPHINADGDAIGSVLGLWKVLKNKGLRVKVISPNSYPVYYQWMNGHDDVLIYSWKKDAAQRIIDQAEMLICMDFNQVSRAGCMEKSIEGFSGTKVLIDHHPNPGDFINLCISDPSRSSTAELVYALLEKLDYLNYLDSDAASALFAGIMTDTGSFDYNVSHPETFQIVSKLLAYGINQEEIHSQIYDNFSAERMRLLGHCLANRMVVFPEYHAAYIYINIEDQKEYHFKKGDSEGFVNYPLSIKGIRFSALFTENEDYIKLSFRSKGSFPVNLFSEENFNGGGHLNAAGGEIVLTLQEAIDKFVALLPVYENKLKESEK